MSAGSGNHLRRDGRIAGVLYLVVVLTGMFCLAYVPSKLGGTLAETSAHADLFRAGIAAFMAMQVAFLLLPLALYRVLADVNLHAACLMVALAAVSVPIGLVALTHRMEALSLLQDAGANADAAFALCLQRYGYGLRIASLFWGLWLLPFGWLVLRSGRLPRVLGLVPDLADSALIGYVRLPAAFGEIGSCLWLLVFGARAGRIGVSPPANP